MTRIIIRNILILMLISFYCPTLVFAVGSAGFENASFGARSLGRANAYVADGEEPSVLGFNPALMTEVQGTQITLGTTFINPYPEHNGSNGGVSENGTVQMYYTPGTFITTDLRTERVFFGFGYAEPFGLATEYSSTGFAQYVGYFNELRFLGFTPTVAVKATPWLSLGAGATYYDSSLEQIVALNNAGTTQNGKMWLDVTGQGWGWNAGVLLKPHQKHSIGIQYRSPAHVEYKGGLSVESVAGPVYPALFGGSTFYTNVNSDITLPPCVTVGYAFRPTERLTIETDLNWTGWSTYDRVELALSQSNAVLDALTPSSTDNDDTINVHVGAKYKLNDQWTLRGGYLFYETPVRDDNFSPTNPDNNRHGVAVGMGYEQKKFALDVAYMAMFAETREVNNTVGNASGANVDGTYKAFSNIAAVSVTYKLD